MQSYDRSQAPELPQLAFPPSLRGLLADKVGIVTGASRGIGAATARAFVEAGAKVVLAARDGEALETLSDSINSTAGKEVAIPLATDVTDPEAVRKLVEKTVEVHGRLDMAFNNAGDGHMPAPLADVSVEDFDRAVTTNVRGTFLSMKYEIPAMLRNAEGGAIVNMSSTAGLQGVKGISGYVAGKHAIIGLTRAAALDYGKEKIRVNVVAPGPILTERLAFGNIREQAAFAVPMGRVGNREEVATVVSWLCSDLSSFVTGSTISIDGGRMSGTWFSAPPKVSP
jgi:NAD(P)-dependent dehydrogenase (short-subunit alcohol dehydrogenase family)